MSTNNNFIVTVLGVPAAGKQQLLQKLNERQSGSPRSVGCSSFKLDETQKVDLWDAPSQPLCQGGSGSFSQPADALIVLFDLSSDISIEDQVKRFVDPNPNKPIILVGNQTGETSSVKSTDIPKLMTNNKAVRAYVKVNVKAEEGIAELKGAIKTQLSSLPPSPQRAPIHLQPEVTPSDNASFLLNWGPTLLVAAGVVGSLAGVALMIAFGAMTLGIGLAVVGAATAAIGAGMAAYGFFKANSSQAEGKEPFFTASPTDSQVELFDSEENPTTTGAFTPV